MADRTADAPHDAPPRALHGSGAVAFSTRGDTSRTISELAADD